LIGPKVDKLFPGKPLSSKLIIVVSLPYEAAYWSFAERFRRAFVKDGGLYKIEPRYGKLIEKGYPPILEAEDGKVEGVFDFPWEMGAPLLVKVRGLYGREALFLHGGRRLWLPIWNGKAWILLGDRCGGKTKFAVKAVFGGCEK